MVSNYSGWTGICLRTSEFHPVAFPLRCRNDIRLCLLDLRATVGFYGRPCATQCHDLLFYPWSGTQSIWKYGKQHAHMDDFGVRNCNDLPQHLPAEKDKEILKKAGFLFCLSKKNPDTLCRDANKWILNLSRSCRDLQAYLQQDSLNNKFSTLVPYAIPPWGQKPSPF